MEDLPRGRLSDIMADTAVSEYVKAAVILLKDDEFDYNCRIRLPQDWRTSLRDIHFLNTLKQEDLFFFLAQAIDSRYFLSTSKFQGVEEMVQSRLLLVKQDAENESHTVYPPSYCCVIRLQDTQLNDQQRGFSHYFRIQALPMKVQVIKGNHSVNISQFNAQAIRKIRACITDYGRYLFRLNGMDLADYPVFSENYLIISEYHPGQHLVLTPEIINKSYEHMIDIINQLELKTFNKNYFVAEIIGPTLVLWICFYNGVRAFRLELLYSIDITLLCSDEMYFQFSSRLAMFIELARLEFSSWRLPIPRFDVAV